MRTLAYTILQDDMVLLDLWIRYYSRYFDDLFVMCYGTKKKNLDKLEYIKSMGKFDYEYIMDQVGEPEKVVETIKEYQQKFLKKYDWVLYCNLDEYLITDPKKYTDLKDLMGKTKKKWVYAICYDVMQCPGEHPIDYSSPVLAQRINWLKNRNYNKVLLSRVPLTWNAGAHQINEIPGQESMALRDNGLYLVHLKHMDPSPAGDRELGPHYSGIPAEHCPADKEGLELIPEWIKII